MTDTKQIGLGVLPPPGYASSTPLGGAYTALSQLWQNLNGLQAGDGSAGAGIAFSQARDAALTALSAALAQIMAIDQSTQQYEAQLSSYGDTLRAQLAALQAQCGTAPTTTTPTAPTPPSGGGGGMQSFTPPAAGLIALGSMLVGGIIGFVTGRKVK